MVMEYNIDIGSVLDGFKIEKELGRGGMGVVYKAHELSLNRMVALKVLSHRLCADTEFVERFKREARVIAALNHPNIVNILTYGETRGLYYFAMEYLTGRDLGMILKEKRRLPLEEALSIVSQVAGALADAGAKGVVHRDLKPSNIMVDEVGRVKVTDFGVAHFQETEHRLTQTGLFLGTPEYASPEQATGRELDVRSDIYALGAVLYSMLSGGPPVTGPSPLAVVAKIAAEPVTPIRQIYPELPGPVCDLIDKMMAREKEDRFQTPQEVMAAVDQCVAGLKGDVPPVKGQTAMVSELGPRPRKRQTAAVWGGILGVALAIVLVVWFVEGGLFKPEPAEESGMSMKVAVDQPGNDRQPVGAGKAAPAQGASSEKGGAISAQGETTSGREDLTTADMGAKTIPATTESDATGSAPARESEPVTGGMSAEDATRQGVRVAGIPPAVAGGARESEAPEAAKPPPPVLPKVPTVLLAISGENDLAMQVRPYLASALRASGLQVTSAAEIPVLAREMQFGGTQVTWHDIRQLLPADDIHILVLARVRKTGAMDLQYYGRTQSLITAAFSARALDMANGVSVAMPATASMQYTVLNMQEKIETAISSATAGMGPSIRHYWRKKLNNAHP